MSKVIGIDLGTTNSCTVGIIDGKPVVIPNKGGYKTTPSVVAVTDEGKRLVGHVAKRQAITNPRNTIYGAKRLIGRRHQSQEVQTAIETSPFQIVEGPHDDVRVVVGNKELSVPEISAMILMEMKSVAEQYFDGPIDGAVITIPAYFNDDQRQATKDAGKIAGLNVLRIINEPTAAALAYGYNKDLDETVAIYDLGGGTFDISILEISGGVFRVIGTHGDTYLGGEDFDRLIMEHLIDVFYSLEAIDLREDNLALQRLKAGAEIAKMELSISTSAKINLPFLAQGPSGPKHFDYTLSRDRLEQLVKPRIEKSLQICKQCLEICGMQANEVSEVILVGGQTRMPLVQQMVQDYFGKPPKKGVHPDEVVAIGAAIQAMALTDSEADVLLLDVTPLSLGIATHGGKVSTLIEHNTTIPVQRKHIFTTAKDNQTAVKIHVLQGESETAAENVLLGEFILSGLEAKPAGEVEIEVSFNIDADGIVSVNATDLAKGGSQSISVQGSSGLTGDELDGMIKTAREAEQEIRSAG